MQNKFLFVVAVFLSHIVQGISGFAGTVLAVPAGSLLVGLQTSIVVMNMAGIVVSVYICLVAWQYIRWHLLRKIFAVMLPGLLLGFVLVGYLREYEKIQQITLGLFIITVGVSGMVQRQHTVPKRDATFLLFIGGIFHGMYICGGTLLVMYLKEKLTKNEFRATISLVWLVLNSINFWFHYHSGYWDTTAVTLTLISTPLLFVSVYLGGIILRHISQAAFVNITNILIALSGTVLLLNALCMQ